MCGRAVCLRRNYRIYRGFVALAFNLPKKPATLRITTDAGSAQLEEFVEENSGIDAGTGNDNRELVVVVRNASHELTCGPCNWKPALLRQRFSRKV
jgi:hypothetical protein